MPDPRSEGPGYIQDRAKNTLDSTTTQSGGIVTLYQGQTIAAIDLSGIATPTTNTEVVVTITNGAIVSLDDPA